GVGDRLRDRPTVAARRPKGAAGQYALGLPRILPAPRSIVGGSGAHPQPACDRPDWKQEIARMRLRIEKERTPAGQDALAFKTGRGGLIDAEFIAQALCLEHGWT